MADQQRALQPLREAEFKDIVLTNTIPIPSEKLLPHITVLSVARLFADAIQHIHEGSSVSELFRWERE